ncbi:cysteine desulfurase family protein [Paenibacillus alvei]|uniref:Cysteine desulfurase n=1 Tax=Paenibacillus alvei TaxID=44250 RepID=A0AAP7DHK4_PAEAL|nr:cysteine desulfurase family protein [Paenibacillus alvei]NOJ69714.1 cysteine desulfurase [Paenibacillus alvei]
MSTTQLYFDHCASTPPHPDVIRTVAEVMEQVYANPSSIHGAGGQAEQLLRRAREVVARALQVEPEEILFTSGATESNNLAIFGIAKTHQAAGKPVHIIVSEIEHASVYKCVQQLEQEGVEVTYLPVDTNGRVRTEDVEAAIRPHTVLVSIMHVNNEMGATQPVGEIGQILRRYPKVTFHVDGVQGLGKVPVRLAEWGVDLYSLSGHKIQGPRGAGVLVKRKHIMLQPLMYGGAQEGELRPGTENVPAIVGLAKAVRLAVEGQAERYNKLTRLRQSALEHLSQLKPLVVNNPADPYSAPHIINVSFPGMKSEVVVHALEQRGIIVSTQSACSSKLHKPSRVLLAMTHDSKRASSGIRISLDASNTEMEIDRLVKSFKEMTEQLQPLVQR